MEMKTPRTPPTLVEEMALYAGGYFPVAGIDEVGRGPLAGPVVAGAVVLPRYFNPPWLNKIRDSKQLTPRRREEVLGHIQDAEMSWGIGVVSPQEVDSLGIVRATKKAMVQAVKQLAVVPSFLLIDAVPLPESGAQYKAIVKGDQRSLSIAAASIVAKVMRDRMMVEEDLRYPGYGFAVHKGYPTKAHLEHLHRLGPSPIHRLSFAPVKALVDGFLVQPTRRKELGDTGENVAREYLEGKGYLVLDTNFRCPYGEVDIVALHGDCLVFLEVRTRRSREMGTPEESVTPKKGKRLIATAETYIQAKKDLPAQWRIDVAAVDVDRRNHVTRIEQIENAVTYGP